MKMIHLQRIVYDRALANLHIWWGSSFGCAYDEMRDALLLFAAEEA